MPAVPKQKEPRPAAQYTCADIPAFGEKCDPDFRRPLPPPSTYRKGFCLLHPAQRVGTCECEQVHTQEISQARAWKEMRKRFLKAQETVRELELQRALQEEVAPLPAPIYLHLRPTPALSTFALPPSRSAFSLPCSPSSCISSFVHKAPTDLTPRDHASYQHAQPSSLTA